MQKNVIDCAFLVLILAGAVVGISLALEQAGVSASAQAQTPAPGMTSGTTPVSNPVGFQELSLKGFNGEVKTLTCNRDGTKLGVVSGSVASEFNFSGQHLQIWNLSPTLQPERILYRALLKGSYDPNITWVGDYLVFSQMESKTEEEIERELEKSSYDVPKFIHGYALSARNGNLTPFTPVQSEFLLPFPSPTSPNQAFVINSFQDVMSASKAINSLKGKRPAPFSPARLHDIAANKTIKQFALPVMGSGISAEKDFVPLFFAEDSQYLVGTTSSDFPWKNKEISNNHLKYLISIKLTDSSAKSPATLPTRSLTSEVAPDSLYLRNNQPFSIGLPRPVDGGKMVVCALNAYERNLNYRFQYYTPSGKLVKEVKVNDRDMQRAGLPAAGEPITWTPSGDAIVQIGSDVWFFDIKNWKSTKIATDLLVDEVHEWVQERSVLVRVRKVLDRKTTRLVGPGRSRDSSQPIYSFDRYWGFLTLPPAK